MSRKHVSPSVAASSAKNAFCPSSRHPGFGLGVTTMGGRLVAVTERILSVKPFCRVIHFERDTRRADPGVLIIPALSGHFATLLRDMLAALMPEHDLYIMDWIDARDVPVDRGDFSLDDNIAYIMDCIEHLGHEINVIAICQSAMPALAATAIHAAHGKTVPRTLTLFGGMIDPRISPTQIGRIAASLPISWFRRHAIETVSPAFPGHGRQVYPAARQRTAFFNYLLRHLAIGGELFQKLLDDDGDDPQRYPFLRLYLTVMDLPAHLFLDTIRLVFHEPALPLGRLRWRGHAVEPSALAETALMTIEAEFDDVSSRGKTRVAHDLCPNIPAHKRRHYVQPGVGHFGMFHGHIWRAEVMPRLHAFFREMA